MDRTKATRESVFKACEELLLTGEYPSARAVVAITKGSLSTVAPLRDEWWRLLAVNYRDSRYLKGLPADVSDFLTGVWNSASALASKAFEEQASQLRLALSERDAEHDALRTAVAAAQADLLLSQDAVKRLTDQVAHLQDSISRQDGQHAAELLSLRAQLRDAHEANARQAAEAQAAASEASRRLAETADAAAEERRRLLIQVDTARQESVRLAEASSTAAARHSAAIDALNGRLDAANAATEHASRDAATARTDAATSAARLVAAEQSNAALRNERDSLAARLASSEATVASQSELLVAQTVASQALNSTLDSLKRMLESDRTVKETAPRQRTRKKSSP